jgi:predicted  nucleic acid-binding Zn-ribbon protein
MAVRSGAGTGVVVSLVVFVLTTVFLLVLTIVFYAGKTKEMEAKASAEQALGTYVRANERSSDTFKAYEAAAKDRRMSVAGYLTGRYEEMMNFVGGDSSLTIEALRSDLKRYKLGENQTVRARVQEMFSDLTARQGEIDGLNAQAKTLSDSIAEKEAQIKQMAESHQQEMNAVETRIAGYRDAAEEYRKNMQTAVDELNRAKDTMRSRYEGRIRELENETDTLNRELVLLKGKIGELEKARDAQRMKASNPALLVDARIIDTPGTSGEVFIDRGRKDRVVVGMTFEVYGDQAQIRINNQTGELPRGKASLEVTKVNDTTAICKVTRSQAGNPIIRNDVVANAVYDPTHRFKFLIHGKFDINNDNTPTEQEAEYLRGLVVNWGGTVVTGDDLPGDLDFLVLGVEPPKPAPLPNDASPVLLEDWVRRNEANELYNRLFRQAREAQIPVLNANRFFILIGHTER